jgi:hypothetical protein
LNRKTLSEVQNAHADDSAKSDRFLIPLPPAEGRFQGRCSECTWSTSSTEDEAVCEAFRTHVCEPSPVPRWSAKPVLSRPDATHTYDGIEFARWGQCVVPEGEKLDPVPAVYSCATDVEFSELRLDFATAEALCARVLAAIAYERAKADEDGAR